MISLARINLLEVVYAHVRTLRELGQKGVNYGDVAFFFVFPAVLSIPLAYYFSPQLHKQDTDLLTAVSIIGGFLFSLLGMTSQIVDKVKNEVAEGKPNNITKRIYAKEIHSNVAFGILMALASVLTLVIYGFMETPVAKQWKIESVLAWFNYFLLITFFLTLLMIVKRLFVILGSEADDL